MESPIPKPSAWFNLPVWIRLRMIFNVWRQSRRPLPFGVSLVLHIAVLTCIVRLFLPDEPLSLLAALNLATSLSILILSERLARPAPQLPG